VTARGFKHLMGIIGEHEVIEINSGLLTKLDNFQRMELAKSRTAYDRILVTHARLKCRISELENEKNLINRRCWNTWCLVGIGGCIGLLGEYIFEIHALRESLPFILAVVGVIAVLIEQYRQSNLNRCDLSVEICMNESRRATDEMCSYGLYFSNYTETELNTAILSSFGIVVG
jgi:hypothetical protein